MVLPTAKLVEQEARLKLDPAIVLRYSRPRTPADLASVARAYGSLVAGGFDPDEAARVVGLEA